MQNSAQNYRELAEGIGLAVAKRTILRTIPANGKPAHLETWGDVADRVAYGNVSLLPEFKEDEYQNLRDHIANGVVLMSGRHLQHGDSNQKLRNGDVFSNCSSAVTAFLNFYLLLNGSGVGRVFDDDVCLVDWNFQPKLYTVLSPKHPDFDGSKHLDPEQLNTLLKEEGTDNTWYMVPDTREGWAHAVELLESMTYSKEHKDSVLVLDFSEVRPSGSPIGGMQSRPASGPAPLMEALMKVNEIKGKYDKRWKQAMWVDHLLAEVVLVGGARRSARLAGKYWKDSDILEFINIKKKGELWSANNSVFVDAEFWQQDTAQKRVILDSIASAAYFDNSGEPGIVNVDRFTQKNEGIEVIYSGEFVGSEKFQVLESTKPLLKDIATVVSQRKYTQTPNPCGEASLHLLGNYCVLGEIAPYFASSFGEIIDAVKATTRSLIRVNTMNFLYDKEVKRTNRIGVGITGIHEFAWKFFGYGFKDLINEEKSRDFWEFISKLKRSVDEEAERYSKELGVNTPHTNTVIKPSGTVSKLFAITEGVHLPAMPQYLRWVQFRNDDPLVQEYKDKGYPFKELKVYAGMTIIGFPTQIEIAKLGMKDKLVTAAQATPEEQYKWLMLLEKYWIDGVDEKGDKLVSNTGQQVSYTLKYDPEIVSYEEFKEMLVKYQSKIKCCSVMPQVDTTIYEYQPESYITKKEYDQLINTISRMNEEIGENELACSTGACPL